MSKLTYEEAVARRKAGVAAAPPPRARKRNEPAPPSGRPRAMRDRRGSVHFTRDGKTCAQCGINLETEGRPCTR